MKQEISLSIMWICMAVIIIFAIIYTQRISVLWFMIIPVFPQLYSQISTIKDDHKHKSSYDNIISRSEGNKK